MRIQIKLEDLDVLKVESFDVYKMSEFKINRQGAIIPIREEEIYLGTAHDLNEVIETCKNNFVRVFGKYWKARTRQMVSVKEVEEGSFRIEKQEDKIVIYLSVYLNLKNFVEEYSYVELRCDYKAVGELKDKEKIKEIIEKTELSYESPDEILQKYGYIRVRGYHVDYFSRRYNKRITYDVKPYIRMRRKIRGD
jgi:hypothetical protein